MHRQVLAKCITFSSFVQRWMSCCIILLGGKHGTMPTAQNNQDSLDFLASVKKHQGVQSHRDEITKTGWMPSNPIQHGWSLAYVDQVFYQA